MSCSSGSTETCSKVVWLIKFNKPHAVRNLSPFLGAFEKLREATINFVTSVRPSVHMEQLGSHWTDFHEILYPSIFRKSVQTVQVSLKSDTNNGYFPRSSIYIYDTFSLSSSQNGVTHKSCRENQNTHFVFNNPPAPENRVVCEIIWKIRVQPDRPPMTI